MEKKLQKQNKITIFFQILQYSTRKETVLKNQATKRKFVLFYMNYNWNCRQKTKDETEEEESKKKQKRALQLCRLYLYLS